MDALHRWRFGAVAVDAREHRLVKDGLVVPMTHKAFAVLATLLRRHGELVTKSELFQAVWPDVVVTDAALSRAIREVRVALGDNARQPRYVATVYGLGFRFIAALSDDSRRADDLRHQLVGRESDIRQLAQALADAGTGQRQAMLVSGEAGIGKTALVDAFVATLADQRDVWVAQGRCVEQYGAGDAHLPILEALEHLSKRVGAAAFMDAFATYAPTWMLHLPWLAREAGVSAPERAAHEATPRRMLRELAHALDVLSAGRTIVLWLEDLHWSDPSTLEALSYLTGRRDRARLLIIGTFRPEAGSHTAPLLQTLVLQLVQRGQAREIALRPLDVRDVRRYLQQRFAGAPALPIDVLAASVHRRTEGHALFMVAMVDDLVRRGAFVEREGGWTLSHSIAELDDRLPDSLRRLVEDQVARLSHEDRRLVEAAALAGPAFCAAAAAAALGIDTPTAEDGCVRLAQQGRLIESQAGVVWPDGTISAAFRFRHALYWRGVDEGIPAGRRAHWQRRIGARQEQAWGTQCGAIASELAMRFEAAHDIARSLHHVRVAGAAALSRCAYAESIDRLRHGLTLLARLPAERRAREELDLLLPLGPALMASQGYASSDVEAVYRRACLLAETHGNATDVLRALRGQWNVAFLRCNLDEARDTADALLARAGSLDDERMRADAHSKLGWTLLHQGDLHGAASHLQAALDSPLASDPAVLRESPRVAAYLAWALWYGGHPARAAQACELAIDLARRANSPHSTAFALGYVAWVRLLRGEVERALPLVRHQLALSAEYGLAYWRQLGLFLQGAIRAQRGEPGAAIDALRHAIDDMLSSGGRVGVAYLLCILTEAQLAAGQVTDARTTIGEARRLIASTGKGLYAAELERIEGVVGRAEDDGPAGRATARRMFERALAIARRQGARALELRAAMCLARLAGDQGEAPTGSELLRSVRAKFTDEADTIDLVRADELQAVLSGVTPAPRAADAARATAACARAAPSPRSAAARRGSSSRSRRS